MQAQKICTHTNKVEVRWTTKVKEALSDSYEVIEEGMNGRQLPDVKYGYFTNMLADLSGEDTMVMMLQPGTSLWAMTVSISLLKGIRNLGRRC